MALRCAALLLAALAVGCASPPQFRPPEGPPPRPPARRAADEIRVATLNAWAIPFVTLDLVARLDAMGPAVAKQRPDVVCFQEVFSESARARLLHGLGPQWRATTGVRGGLVIASRFPLREAAFTPFPMFSGLGIPERIARKGMLEVVVATQRGPLRVVTAHLALDFGEDNPRVRQLRFLLDRLETRRELPLVLAADLNTPYLWEGEPNAEFTPVLDAGFVPTDAPHQAPDGTWMPPSPTRVGWPRFDILTTVFFPDHILLRSGGRRRPVLSAFGVALDTKGAAVSDHNMLVADIRLEED